MSVTEQDVLGALRSVRYPGFTRDIVSFGIVKELRVEAGRVRFRLELGSGSPAVAAEIEKQARAAVETLEGVRSVDVDVAPVSAPPAARVAGVTPGALDQALIPGVRHTIAVASGKGGVGKSTVAVNLAVALASRGARVGLLDADIYGPSIPLMMGVNERPRVDEDGRRLVPFERFGVRFMSLGFLVERDAAVIWRGPMVMKAIEQLLRDVIWGDLDVLVVDLPPGTGDAQLTLSQKIRMAGAIIVTTPQDVALADAIKGVAMFRKVGVPVMGIIENMSYFCCPRCGTRSEIFGYGGGKREAERLEVPFLGEIPLDTAIRVGGDTGVPVASAGDGSGLSAAFLEVASGILRVLRLEDPGEGAPDAGGPPGPGRKGLGGS